MNQNNGICWMVALVLAFISLSCGFVIEDGIAISKNGKSTNIMMKIKLNILNIKNSLSIFHPPVKICYETTTFHGSVKSIFSSFFYDFTSGADTNAACDCNYHPGGCTISKVAPEGNACNCVYKGGWTCLGHLTPCIDPNHPLCKQPDNSFVSCQLGGGDCGGYKESCDCDYHPGGCTISKKAPSCAACRCSYKGGWTCGGSLVRCPIFTNSLCQNPDYTKDSCVFGGGDCGGY